MNSLNNTRANLHAIPSHVRRKKAGTIKRVQREDLNYYYKVSVQHNNRRITVDFFETYEAAVEARAKVLSDLDNWVANRPARITRAPRGTIHHKYGRYEVRFRGKLLAKTYTEQDALDVLDRARAEYKEQVKVSYNH